MHLRNLYRYYEPDFTALAKQYPDVLGKHVTWDGERAVVDWRSPEATSAVTKTLLLHDLDIRWDMPLEGLCPPVPNRLNYICWLADLVHLEEEPPAEQHSDRTAPAAEPAMSTTTAGKAEDAAAAVAGLAVAAAASGENAVAAAAATQSPVPARGIDVGTGMSCIYPLLGHKVMGWRFLATDTSAEAVEWAKKNVAANGWEDHIEVRLVEPRKGSEASGGDGSDGSGDSGGNGGGNDVIGPLRQALCDSDGSFDFAMTNPPFWASAEEAGLNPNTSTGLTATAAEVACEGGELAFVTAIIQDSLHLGTRVRWYTSMIGRKVNVRTLLRVLREAGIKNVRTTEFFQGKTTRWGLAWSLTTEGLIGGRVPDDPSIKVFGKKKAHHSNEVVFNIPLKGSAAAEAAAVTAAAAAAAAVNPAQPAAASRAADNGAASSSAHPSEEQSSHFDVAVQLPDTLPADPKEVAERLQNFLTEYRACSIEWREASAEEEEEESRDVLCLEGIAKKRGGKEKKGQGHSGGGEAAATARGATTADAAATAGPVPGMGDAAAEAGSGGGGGGGGGGGSGEGIEEAAESFRFDVEVSPADTSGSAQIRARLHQGGDRTAFFHMCGMLPKEVCRQGRRWRRALAKLGAKAGKGGEEEAKEKDQKEVT